MMTRDIPTISVIIPTHNRSASLRRTLDALGKQTCPLQQVEVIVVADGCVDETVEMLHHYPAPFTLRVIEQSGQGAAAARNHGAAAAQAGLLLFLDDDIEATPTLIEVHVRVHQGRTNQVAIGFCPPAFQGRLDFFRMGLRIWWANQFNSMRQPGHRYTYRDLLSSNLSIEATLFNRLGGFDNTLQRREDYELGIRLLEAGVSFTVVPEALGYHHDATDVARAFRQTYQHARADVQIGRVHPKLRAELFQNYIKKSKSRIGRFVCTLAFKRSATGDWLADRLQLLFKLLERMRLRRQWYRLYRSLSLYWYWRGIAEELGSQRGLAGFLQNVPSHSKDDSPELELDLREGLEVAERRLDQERPVSVRLRYGEHMVGRISPQPGAERLRGVHLRPVLATELAVTLLIALALAGAIDAPVKADHLPAVDAIQLPREIYANKSI